MTVKPFVNIILIFFVFPTFLAGQNFFASNLYNNLVFANPSLVSVNDFSLMQLNYRNQWPVAGVYNTYGASYFHNANNLSSNFGLVLNYDRQLKGVISRSSAGFNYSFKLQTSRRDYLFMGFSGSYNLEQLNYSVLQFENQAPNAYNNDQQSYPYFNAGISYFLKEQHLFGASVTNIYPFTLSSPYSQRGFDLQYLGKIEPRGYQRMLIYIEPVISLDFEGARLSSSLGSNLGVYNFKSGLMLNQTNFSINSLTILLGISFDNYELIYSHDLNLSTRVTINPKMAAHEVTFLRKFQYKGRRKHRGAIKCPDI